MILKGGLVIDPKNKIHEICDIEFENGKIVKIGKELSGSETLDMKGKWIIPGVIDSHLHLCMNNATETVASYRKVVETGVTTAIDFAGPVSVIVKEINEFGYGLNVACLEAISLNDSSTHSYDISKEDISKYLDRILSQGAIGPKLLCGHYPITPRAIKDVIQMANDRKLIVAYHAGSTEHSSDLNGMKEAIELCGKNKMVLAHINAYLRGKTKSVFAEMDEAFELLEKHPNVFSDCHLAVMNSCFGKCIDGIPEDNIVKNCLGLVGLPVTKDGIIRGIKEGKVKVIITTNEDIRLVEGEEALKEFIEKDSNVKISFAVNVPYVAAACLLKRRKSDGDFLIPMTGTDGGFIPRNNLPARVMYYYGLGYISLDDAVRKMTSNTAEIFGLKNKGHLGVGADADVTVINPKTLNAEMSFIGGEIAMKNNVAVKRNGKILTTKLGTEYLKKMNVNFDVIDSGDSLFYKN